MMKKGIVYRLWASLQTQDSKSHTNHLNTVMHINAQSCTGLLIATLGMVFFCNHFLEVPKW